MGRTFATRLASVSLHLLLLQHASVLHVSLHLAFLLGSALTFFLSRNFSGHLVGWCVTRTTFVLIRVEILLLLLLLLLLLVASDRALLGALWLALASFIGALHLLSKADWLGLLHFANMAADAKTFV